MGNAGAAHSSLHADGHAKQLERFALGAIGVLAIFLGLRVVFGAFAGGEETALWYALRFVRHELVGLWAGRPWPIIAVPAGLAVSES